MFETLLGKGIKNLTYFSKGRRGLIYLGEYRKKQIIVKMRNPDSKAINRMENETAWLKRLNREDIGPRLLFSGKDYFCYEYVKGDFIIDFIGKSSKKEILRVIKGLFDQTYTLDKMKVDKEEMHMPFKHIIVNKSKVTLLDFERCHSVEKPKNTTQFCQFVTCGRIGPLLKQKNIVIDESDIREAAARYKKNYTKMAFRNILACIR